MKLIKKQFLYICHLQQVLDVLTVSHGALGLHIYVINHLFKLIVESHARLVLRLLTVSSFVDVEINKKIIA